MRETPVHREELEMGQENNGLKPKMATKKTGHKEEPLKKMLEDIGKTEEAIKMAEESHIIIEREFAEVEKSIAETEKKVKKTRESMEKAGIPRLETMSAERAGIFPELEMLCDKAVEHAKNSLEHAREAVRHAKEAEKIVPGNAKEAAAMMVEKAEKLVELAEIALGEATNSRDQCYVAERQFRQARGLE